MEDAATLTPADPIPPAQPSTLRKIFVGKEGLRAGWSLLIFFAILAALSISANLIGHKLHQPSPKSANANSEITPLFGFIGEGVPFVLVLIVTWIMSKIERRPVGVYGFGDSRKVALFRRPGLGN